MDYNKEWEYGTPVDCDCESNFIHIDCGCKPKDVCECENILLEISKLKTQDTVLQREIDAISGVVDTKLDASAYTPVDMSDYYTKSEVDSKIPSLDGYATEEYVNAQISSQTSDFVTGEQLSSYTYDKATIDEKIASGGIFDPTQYYNKTEVNNIVNSAKTAVEAEIPTVPTNVSAFNNDAHYVTSASTETQITNHFWCGTQAEYDALPTKQNNVLYLIHE